MLIIKKIKKNKKKLFEYLFKKSQSQGLPDVRAGDFVYKAKS
jgi:hypothetical protein